MTSRFHCLPPWFVPSMEDIERLESIGIARMMQAHIYADKRTHIIHKTGDTTQDTQCTTDLQDAIHNIGHAIQDTQHTHTQTNTTHILHRTSAHIHIHRQTEDWIANGLHQRASQQGIQSVRNCPLVLLVRFLFLPNSGYQKMVTKSLNQFSSIFDDFLIQSLGRFAQVFQSLR